MNTRKNKSGELYVIRVTQLNPLEWYFLSFAPSKRNSKDAKYARHYRLNQAQQTVSFLQNNFFSIMGISNSKFEIIPLSSATNIAPWMELKRDIARLANLYRKNNSVFLGLMPVSPNDTITTQVLSYIRAEMSATLKELTQKRKALEEFFPRKKAIKK
jgi:hypothetical protein